MSEALRAVYNVVERSNNISYMTNKSGDRYINNPDSNKNEYRNSFEDYKK